MEKLSYKTDVFEGPLDLLLHLIEKNKLNIYDILISELLDQYMEQIDLMQQQDLDIAGEFLAMASRLIQIKSAMLLPKYEEAEEMRKELSGQLIEYRKCKRVAAMLQSRVSFDSFCREPAKIKAGKLRIPPPKDAFSGIVARRIVSVSSKIYSVIRKLRRTESRPYREMFDDAADRSELVATFLAILELIKGKRVRVTGDGEDCELRLIMGGESDWNEQS